jgi:PAS domain S-box-containing protein
MKYKSSGIDNSSDNQSRKPSLTRIIFIIPMLVATIVSICFALYFSITELINFNEGNAKLKKEFPLQQRHELIYRILTAKNYIQFVRTHSNGYIHTYVNNQLKEAANIVGKDAPFLNASSRLSPAASDSLNQIFRNSAINIAVINQKGEPVYFVPADPASIQALKNIGAKAIFDGSIPSVDSWIATNRKNNETRVIVKQDVTSGLSILAQIDLRDSTKIIQELILDSLSRIRYNNGEYIFINTLDGHGLITKGVFHRTPLDIITGKDTNWIQIFKKEIICAQDPSGNFITYIWQKDSQTPYTEKVSFISGINDWKWIIGTGMHTRDIEPILQARREELRTTLLSDLLKFLAFLILLFVIIYFITRWISSLTASSIHIFVKFFKNAANSLQPLDESKFRFREFHILGKAANQMISERDRIASDLATEQSRLKYIIDAIPDLIFFKDINSLFVGCNRAFEKYVGLKSDKIIGCSEYDLFPNTYADTYLASDKILLETLEPTRNTEWITYPDGRKVLCDTLKTLYFDANGNVLGIIGISRDITEMEETRQRLIMAKEKAEESDRLKTAFLANMSHEIRTPMNAIIGFSDLLSDEYLEPSDREDFISKIKLSGESLMNIINDIIDIAKIEAGQLKITDSECNVDQLLNVLFGTFNEIKSKTNKTALELKVFIPKLESPLVMITDPLRLQQVLTNLLSNALKFTEFGEIEFGYRMEENKVHFLVRDTGIGILRSKQQLLFQRFSQVDTSTTRKYGGTGLGLAISRNIVELMGGTIWLESEPGQGSTFHFTLPYRKVEHVAIESPVTIRDYDWKDRTILIAEDMEQNYLLLEAILRFTGVTLLHAVNGQQAIDMVKEEPGIHLVLMDIQLPIKTGYEAIHEIRQLRPELPIISFTAYALPREREKSLEAGCVDFINKPIKPDAFLAVVQKYIKN